MADLLKPINYGLFPSSETLQIRIVHCDGYNYLKYDLNHFEKGKYSLVRHVQRKSVISATESYNESIIIVYVGHGFYWWDFCFYNQALKNSINISIYIYRQIYRFSNSKNYRNRAKFSYRFIPNNLYVFDIRCCHLEITVNTTWCERSLNQS